MPECFFCASTARRTGEHVWSDWVNAIPPFDVSGKRATLPGIGARVKRSWTDRLAESHVAAVAIALLLAWSLEAAFAGVWGPLSHLLGYLMTAAAILDVPYFSRTLTTMDRLELLVAGAELFYAFVYLAAACLLSGYVYGTGPIRSLSQYRSILQRRNHD
jgi:hypothetical protein